MDFRCNSQFQEAPRINCNSFVFTCMYVILAISDQYATYFLIFFTKWPPVAILYDRKSLFIAFLAISDQYATFICLSFFTKWTPAAILYDRKSLSIAFLAISDQYAAFFKIIFTKCPPAAILDDRKSLSIAFLAILDKYITFFGRQCPFWMPNFATIDRDLPL